MLGGTGHSAGLHLASTFAWRQVSVAWQVETLMRHREAEAVLRGITWCDLAADVDPDYEDPQGLLGTPHECHVALINYLGPTQLFDMLCKVCCLASS